MSSAILWTLAIAGPLLLAALGTFAVFVIGIRRGDRGHLGNAPRTSSDAIARRCLTGIRTDDRKARLMILASEVLAIEYASRHCTEYGCRKCIARAHWNKRKQWRTRKKAIHRKTGRK